ncbi:hypothetical protein BFW38_03970 [Terasakiispira papahanaumokuakeensis]|uniref:Lysine transporter LysE n=1 Tax=Terasakiispira papahanaumokuakeensis TaxID=197479 RepID=A0A1E2V7E0_9GAMM|nr:LysE family translocator [Terasakiispira papahanaumokuakeensis]ODC02833.1 hypothetical protein BFW38_03970 [Terasakiispira papahanaumokuakeensis]
MPTTEIIAVATITLLATISPGPDFALITRIALNHGHRAATQAAWGIASAICIHVTYTLLGLGLILQHSDTGITLIRYLGAAYLIYLGLTSWLSVTLKHRARAQPTPATSALTTASITTATTAPQSPSKWRQRWQAPWTQGFLCNLLNPKTLLFIVALFSQVISPQTPLPLQIGYGLWIALVHGLWFSLVSRLLNSRPIRQRLTHIMPWVDRLVGTALIALGLLTLQATA